MDNEQIQGNINHFMAEDNEPDQTRFNNLWVDYINQKEDANISVDNLQPHTHGV